MKKKRPKLKIYKKGIEASVVYADKDKKIVTKVYESGRHRNPFAFEPITKYEMQLRFEEIKELRKKLKNEKEFEIVEPVEIKEGHTVKGKEAIIWKEKQVDGYSVTQIRKQWDKVREMADKGNPETMKEYEKLREMVGKDVLPRYIDLEKGEKMVDKFYEKVKEIREKIKEAYSKNPELSEQKIEKAASNYIWDPKRKKFVVVDVIRPDEYTGF